VELVGRRRFPSSRSDRWEIWRQFSPSRGKWHKTSPTCCFPALSRRRSRRTSLTSSTHSPICRRRSRVVSSSLLGCLCSSFFDAIGMPINTLGALNSSGVAFGAALQAGNASAAAAAILDAPANMANGFLNGQTLIGLPNLTTNITIDGFPLGSLTTSAELPVGGLLTPLSPVVLNPGGAIPGTPIGGFIPGLLSFGSELAAAITPLG